MRVESNLAKSHFSKKYQSIMKMRVIIPIIGMWLACMAALPAQAQSEPDSTGLPGDHFSLQGALELFKRAQSPEEFEKLLNLEESSVNNLDLNEDGEIDYIRVIDHAEGNAHAIVLQAVLGKDEFQDVAVIEIEKTGEQEAIAQIIGDEALYGEMVIVEPVEEVPSREGKGGPSVDFEHVVVNVWFWPCVRFIYSPAYVVWVSPWHWGYWPGWWRPWHPRPWHVFIVHVRPWHRHYHVVHVHRVVKAHHVYAPRRVYSPRVQTRTTTIVKHQGPRGKTKVSRTTTRTTLESPRGRAGVETREKTQVKTPRGTTITKEKTTRQRTSPRSQGRGNAPKEKVTAPRKRGGGGE